MTDIFKDWSEIDEHAYVKSPGMRMTSDVMYIKDSDHDGWAPLKEYVKAVARGEIE